MTETRRVNQQKPKTQMKMKTTKNYEVNYCKMCGRFWWMRMFSHINTLPTLLMNCKGCKYSQLHMSVKHDHEHERKEHMMSRRQQHQHPHKEGLALCHRVTLESVAHWWVPARTPTVHQCLYGGRLWVAHNKLHKTTPDRRPQDTDKP